MSAGFADFNALTAARNRAADERLFDEVFAAYLSAFVEPGLWNKALAAAVETDQIAALTRARREHPSEP